VSEFTVGPTDPKTFALEHLDIVGFTPLFTPMSQKAPSFEIIDPIFENYSLVNSKSYHRIRSHVKHSGVKPNYDNVWKSILKCDRPLYRPTNELHQLALEYTKRMLLGIMVTPPQMTGLSYVPEASPGKIYKISGFSTKGEALGTPLFHELWNTDYTIVWSVSGKIEDLLLSDIINDNKFVLL